MRRFMLGRFVGFIALFCGVIPAMQAAVQNRISNGAGAARVALPLSVSRKIAKATDLGEADGNAALSSMTLRFSMTDVQKAALTQLLADQQNPASPKYHQWLTPEQYAAQFGLSSADMTTVSQWLTSQGFKITATARSRTFIQFSGTVAQAQTAFKTSVHKVTLDGEEHLANVTAVSLPSGIAGVVGSVAGLNDFRLKPRAKLRQIPAKAQTNPEFYSTTYQDNFIAPGDFYTIYDVKPLLANSINGTGITIAIAGQTDIVLSDIAAFRTASGLSVNVPTVKLYGKDPGTPMTDGVADDENEADLDLEWSGAVAPSASIIYANSTDVFNSLAQIIDNRLAPIASISYGECEVSAQMDGSITSLNSLFMQGNAEGMTVVGPAGDSGATDCDDGVTTATNGLAVDFPASSPFVTGVGGTMFVDPSTSYFGTTNGTNGGSALSYIPEEVWNETTYDVDHNGTIGAGGGGLSDFFTKPYWQTGVGVPNDFARDVPDVALNAAANHNGYLICSQGSCVNGGFSSSTAGPDVVGGTSVSTPSFAGILALVEQKIGATNGVGNANPVIYALANSSYYGTVFHDVTTGNNASPCTAGSTDCPSGGSIGYSATTGYDLATGWGSVDAFNLANSWTLVTPATGGTTGTELSTTTVTASSASVSSGTAVTITATLANGGTTTETASPTGTVQFLVDNVASGAGVAVAGGVATFSLATAALASGNHVISAAYSGDSVYASSKGSVTIDIVSSTAADFALTPATATVTTASGSDAPGVTFTVTPSNGFTGSVAFSASTTSSTLNATYAFSVTPVVISSTAAGTTVLTLSAYDVNGDAVGSKGKLRLRPIASASAAPPVRASRGWVAGSGAALACVALLMVPRRRKFGALFGVLMAVAALGGALGMSGCGGGTSTISTASSNTTAGTYTINVTATGANAAGTQLTHNATVTFVVQ